MRNASLGPVGTVSRLTLGGGGIGQIWGETSRDEAYATIALALDSGIDVIDTAPMYGQCEATIGEMFAGTLPAGVKITSKCRLGTPPLEDVERNLAASLESSLRAMRLGFIDVFFLHTNICEDDYVYAFRPERKAEMATTWTAYADGVIPAMERLKARGLIGHWGITGTGVPRSIVKALSHVPRPAVVQAIANLLDSAGGMKGYAEPEQPRAIIAAAVENGAGVMGIRAVQAGALTNAIDRTLGPNHPETRDFAAAAPYRALCRELGLDPAVAAHRYALSMAGVDTVILGVKNRDELRQCLDAEKAGPLDAGILQRIDALGLAEGHR